METRIDDRAVLTTEHSASSYGQPVLVMDGQIYGPGDQLPNGELAAEAVAEWAADDGRTQAERVAALSFLEALPYGPRICVRCGHTWVPRKLPVRECPGCRSVRWDRPRSAAEGASPAERGDG